MVGLVQCLTDHLAAPAASAPRERMWQVRAREVVLATARSSGRWYSRNDRPGVMLASAARTFLHRFGVRVGSRIAVLAGCDEAYAAALDLHEAGARIAIVADVRAAATGEGVQAARAAGLRIAERATVLATTGLARSSQRDARDRGR